jgi:NhaA family Na+:H+ antiporter
VIVPLFALANAGVVLSGGAVREALSSTVTLGVVLGLVVGKTIGVTGGAWFARTTGLASLPAGVRWRDVFAVAVTAGIGFTVSLLMADLAFRNHALIEAAKVGILVGSLTAGIVGAVLLRAAGRAPRAGL